MATAMALDPATELEQRVEAIEGVQPLVTIAQDMALASYRLSGGVVLTQVWLHGQNGWSMFATDRISG
jgi:hypothetical protein